MRELEFIIYKPEAPIATISLNRPHRLNSYVQKMKEELTWALRDIATKQDVRVVLLKGEGKAFCSGMDLKELSTKENPHKSIETSVAFNRAAQNRRREIMNLDKPIIALVQGWCVAGGFELALSCDFRIAAEDAKFWISEPQFGGGINMGVNQLLAQVIGLGRAKEMILTTEPVDAYTAEKWGLVSKVVPREKLEEAGMEMAKKIIRSSPLAIKLFRQLMDSVPGMSVEQALDAEQAACVVLEADAGFGSSLGERVKKL
jgi:enoyl-CoA hydratase/carnithine racemase